MRSPRITLDEWQVLITRPRKGGKFRVTIENTSDQDKTFTAAAARLIEVWINATRRRA